MGQAPIMPHATFLRIRPWTSNDSHFDLALATSEAEIRAAQRLRYDVFIEELGGDGTLVDHDARIEADRFDPFFDHLLLRDRRRARARTWSASTA
jgi:putative hemolysin